MTSQVSSLSDTTTSGSSDVVIRSNFFQHKLELYDGDDSLPESAFRLDVASGDILPGESIGAAMARADIKFDLPTVIVLDDEIYLSRAEWFTYPIIPGQKVEVISRPLGGGSSQNTAKSIVAVVAMIALTVVAGPTGFVGAALATTLGSFGGALASAAIIAAGSFAISHFLQPKQSAKSNTAEELYTFGFGGNTSRPLQPIPVQYGRFRSSPDFGSPPYSEFNGDTMTDYSLLVLGCGKHDIEKIEVGDTLIWSKTSGYNPDFTGMSHQIAMNGEDITLFPVNVVTANELNGVELSQTWSTPFVINGPLTVATALKFDLVWASGAFVTFKDRELSPNTGVQIQIRRINDQGAPITDWFDALNKQYNIIKKSAYRLTETVYFELPAGTIASEALALKTGQIIPKGTAFPAGPVGGNYQPGRYEARVRRTTVPISDADSSKIGGTDAVTLTAARAVIRGPQSFPGVTCIALKGVANKQNSGANGGLVHITSTRIIPVFKNGQWVEEASRSIHWAAIDAWRNSDYSAGLDLSRLDFPTFLQYGNFWDGRNETFDYRFTEVQNIDEVLDTILRAGRAFSAAVGDRITLVREEPRGLAKMLFTDFEIVGDSLEVDYTLADQTWADGMVGTYVDERTWRLAEVNSAPTGVTLVNPARVELKGIVKVEQALDAIRFMAAESQYRRVMASWTTRMEGRLLTKGSLVKITTDHPEYWGASFEVLAFDENSGQMELTGEPKFDTTAGAQNYIEIRTRDGSPSVPLRVVPVDYLPNFVRLLNPTGVLAMIDRSGYESLPTVAFSPGQPRTFSVLITGGDPDQDGEHITLRGVVDAPEVYNTLSGGVPPQYQLPDIFSTTRPRIDQISASIVQRQLNLLLTVSWLPAKNAVSYIADVSYDGKQTWVPAYRGDVSAFEAIVGASDNMWVRVAGVTLGNDRGGYSETSVQAPSLIVSNQTVGAIIVNRDDLVSDIKNTLFGPDSYPGSIAATLKKADEAKAAADTVKGTADAAAARVEVVNTNLISRVVDEATARIDGDSVNASAIQAVTVKVNDPVTGLAKTRADVITEQQARADGDSANASAIQVVSSIVNNPTTGLAQTRADLITEYTTRANADSANVSAINVLSSQVNNPSTGLPQTRADLINEYTTRANADTANVNSINLLSSQVNNPSTGLPQTRADLLNEYTTRANADSANASATQVVSAALNDPNTGLAKTRASLADETFARVTQDNAIVSSVQTLGATVDGRFAGGKVTFTAKSAPSGVTARYAIELVTQSNGTTSGTGLYLEVLPNGTGRVTVDANQFLVGDASTGTYPLRVQGGQVYLQNVIVTGSVILPGTVNEPITKTLENTQIYSGVKGGQITYETRPELSHTFTLDAKGSVTIGAFVTSTTTVVGSSQNPGNANVFFGIFIDGVFMTSSIATQHFSVSGASGVINSITSQGSGQQSVFRTLEAGQHTVEIRSAYSSNSSGASSKVDSARFDVQVSKR